jgi:hypothetical protein
VSSFKAELARYDDKLVQARTRFLADNPADAAAKRLERATKVRVRASPTTELFPPLADQIRLDRRGGILMRHIGSPPDYARHKGKPVSASRAHIGRWAKDGRAQEVWATIKENAPNVDAQEFIRLVLKARSDVVALVNRIAMGKDYRDYWIDKYSRATSRLWSSKRSLAAIAQELEVMADGLRQLHEHFSIPQDAAVSREGTYNARARKLFARRLSSFFHELFGQWRDWEVLVLTEIAFPGQKLDEDQIRAMRRPSTRRERRSTSHH